MKGWDYNNEPLPEGEGMPHHVPQRGGSSAWGAMEIELPTAHSAEERFAIAASATPSQPDDVLAGTALSQIDAYQPVPVSNDGLAVGRQ